MWEFEHTETTTATAAQLWRRYADPASWPEWDQQTEKVAIDGPFEAGTSGWLKPVGGSKTKFRLLEATEGVSFTDVSLLPLATMRFTHTISPVEDGVRFTHRVAISGPLSPVFSRVIGKKVAAELPGAMRRLAELSKQA